MRAVYNDLTRSLLAGFSNEQSDENIVFSPFSVLMLMTLLERSTDGETREEISHFLYGDREEQDIARLQKGLTGDKTFCSANAVIVGEEYRKAIKTSYERVVRKEFDGKVITSRDLVKDVNEWVRKKTQDMIPKAIDMAPPDLAVVLLNAVSFDAKWLTPYREDCVINEDFNNADGSVSRVKMLLSSEYGYIENEGVTGFVKPYKDKDYSFMAILPRKAGEKALRSVIDDLDLTTLYEAHTDEKVSVMMPEFTYEYQTRLKDYFAGKGIKTAFSQEARFTPMTDERLFLDDILHKARIEVDRHGTKAAAVSMAMTCGSLPPKMQEVYLDRPFIYAIVHNRTGIPVFAGIVRHLEDMPDNGDRKTPEEIRQTCKKLYKEIFFHISQKGTQEPETDSPEYEIWREALEAFQFLDVEELERILKKAIEAEKESIQ